MVNEMYLYTLQEQFKDLLLKQSASGSKLCGHGFYQSLHQKASGSEKQQMYLTTQKTINFGMKIHMNIQMAMTSTALMMMMTELVMTIIVIIMVTSTKLVPCSKISKILIRKK